MVFHVGARRELLFACVLLSCCIVSVLLVSWPRLEIIIPVTRIFTFIQCNSASKDPYTHYRKGLRTLFRGNDVGAAEKAFIRAVKLDPQDPRYQFHLGRALLIGGNTDAGGKQIREVLSQTPGLVV